MRGGFRDELTDDELKVNYALDSGRIFCLLVYNGLNDAGGAILIM